MKPSMQRFVTIFFLAALTLPATSILWPHDPVEIENRRLEPPSFSIESLLDPGYYQDLGIYVRDANALRAALIAIGTGIDYRVFGDTPNPAEVLFGLDGWMFSRDSFDSLCSDTALTAASNLLALVEALEHSGARVIYSVIPSKLSIQDESLSPELRRLAECGLTQSEALREFLAEGAALGYVDSWQVLETVQEDGIEPYFQTDTHFHYEASVPWMKAIVDAIDPTIWDSGAVVDQGPFEFGGNLSVIIGQGQSETVERVVVDRGLPRVPVRRSGTQLNDDLFSTEFFAAPDDSPSVIPGRTVFLKDSHGDISTPSLAQYFGDLVVLDWRGQETVSAFGVEARIADTIIIIESDTGLTSTFNDRTIVNGLMRGTASG